MEVSESYSPNASVLIGNALPESYTEKKSVSRQFLAQRCCFLLKSRQARSFVYIPRAHIRSQQVEHCSWRPELENIFSYFSRFTPPGGVPVARRDTSESHGRNSIERQAMKLKLDEGASSHATCVTGWFVASKTFGSIMCVVWSFRMPCFTTVTVSFYSQGPLTEPMAPSRE